METDLQMVRRVGRAAIAAALAGVAIPFTCGFAMLDAVSELGVLMLLLLTGCLHRIGG